MTSVLTSSCIKSRIFDFSSAVVSPAVARLAGAGAVAAAGEVAGAEAGDAAAGDGEDVAAGFFFLSNGHHQPIFSSGRFSLATAASVSSAGASHAKASNSTRYQLESVS